MHGAAEVELDLAAGELVGDVARVGQRAREPVELGHHERVAGAARRERLAQPGPVAIGAGEAVIDVDPLGFYAERLKRVALGSQVQRASRRIGACLIVLPGCASRLAHARR